MSEETRGRKPIHDKPMTRVNVTLDAETLEKLRNIGDGNVSANIRMIIAEYVEKEMK